jgi:cation:H+ antiporter
MFLNLLIFAFSCLLIIVSSRGIIDALHRLTCRLGWKEFIVAFFAASIGAVLPELFIGVRSALKGVPEFALGSIIGQNIILFTLSVAICTFILKEIVVESRTVRAGATFALVAVTLPFLLLWDGVLSRLDGAILVFSCVFYIYWLFSKEDHFLKKYDKPLPKCSIWKDILLVFIGFLFVALSAEGIIYSAQNISYFLGIPVAVFALFVVGLGVALPETFFSIALASKGHSWMILGGILGSISLSSTLVLGVVALISPIEVVDFSSLRVAQFFLLSGGFFLLLFVRTSNKITKREAWFLLGVYLLFLLFEFIILK